MRQIKTKDLSSLLYNRRGNGPDDVCSGCFCDCGSGECDCSCDCQICDCGF